MEFKVKEKKLDMEFEIEKKLVNAILDARRADRKFDTVLLGKKEKEEITEWMQASTSDYGLIANVSSIWSMKILYVDEDSYYKVTYVGDSNG